MIGSADECMTLNLFLVTVANPRLSLAGPPLTDESAISVLFSHNVTVGVGPQGIGEPFMSGWAVRNLRWDIGWVSHEGLM